MRRVSSWYGFLLAILSLLVLPAVLAVENEADPSPFSLDEHRLLRGAGENEEAISAQSDDRMLLEDEEGDDRDLAAQFVDNKEGRDLSSPPPR